MCRVRKHSLLPLDDCLYALKEQIPRLTRSSPHRLFQRNGISKLLENKEKKLKKKFKKYPIGYFHIDITEVRTEAGKLYLFVAIDRTSKYESQTSLQEHLSAFINAYNFAKRLKTLHGLTPWEFIVKSWNLHPELFKMKPNPYKLGLNI